MTSRAFATAFRREFKQDNIGDVAAMLTYYAVLALFPMLVFVLTVGLLVIPEATIQQALSMWTRTMPAQAAQILAEHVRGLHAAAGGWMAVVSALLALWAASRGTVALGRALNTIDHVAETRPWWKVQLTAVGVTAAVAVMLLIALALLTVGPAAGRMIAERLALGRAFDVAWSLGRWLLVAAIIMAIWSMLYSVLPDRRSPWRFFTTGSVIGVAIWVLASLVFSVYVQNFGKYEKTYGALGAVIIFLVWLWISNLALLSGAEANYVLETGGESPPARRAAAGRRLLPQN